MKANPSFEPSAVLAALKDFQRRTVDYVFSQLYEDGAPARRFLVADEVGLGKTLVARGVIAKTLAKLQGNGKRINIVYVCSNASIARQNVRRLNVLGGDDLEFPSRLTLLPISMHHLKRNAVNFVSFTPGTALNPVSRGGHKDERIVIYFMLQGLPWLKATGLMNLLQGGVGKDNWRSDIRSWRKRFDKKIGKKFVSKVRGDANMRNELADLCDAFHWYKANIPADLNERRLAITAWLRKQLAKASLEALQPDLIILDEFQRFRDLLRKDSEEAELAQELFDYPDVRILLLSATPYKMLTLDTEREDDHYPDFLKTLEFLFDDQGQLSALETAIGNFRRELLALGASTMAEAQQAKRAVQSGLLKVMCRTERVAMTAERDSMVDDVPMPLRLTKDELEHARFFDRIAVHLEAPDIVEYWKSCPYLLNYLKHYKFRERFDLAAPQPATELMEILCSHPKSLLVRRNLERYEPVEFLNGRMEAISQSLIDNGLWKALWIPPSLPYWQCSGAYADVEGATKALVFSSWNAVPDAIATLFSYDVERRMVGTTKGGVRSELYQRVRPLLRFARTDGRLTGMSVLLLMMPLPELARQINPLELALSLGEGELVPVDALLADVKSKVRDLVNSILADCGVSGPEDQRWYWVAPVLIERRAGTDFENWCQSPDGWRSVGAEHDDDGSTDRFSEHLDVLCDAFEGELNPPLGRPPEDLVEVLTEIALAAPGVCALRTLYHVARDDELIDQPVLLSSAAKVASGFRTMFNLPETIGLLSQVESGIPYWRKTLIHGLEGNLQALLDEQVHMLEESLGVVESPAASRIEAIAEGLAEALSIRTAQISVDEIRARPRKGCIDINSMRMRTRFALRFGELRDENDSTLARADTVRTAFNSPFRPFVLATTSAGQEGLDFHTWCHSLVHWNLPSNPVDFEQREGRVHRYKNHAVRKNVALRYGLRALAERDIWRNPWDTLFEVANEEKPSDASDLVPYWIYETSGGVKVERRVPYVPFSRDEEKFRKLKQGVALYRLVFGQPRQQDLLEYLGKELGKEQLLVLDELRISLVPPE